MHCTRAAVVEYRVVPDTADLVCPDPPAQVDIAVSLEAHITRRLLYRSNLSTPWVAKFHEHPATSAVIPIETLTRTLLPDASVLNDLCANTSEYEDVARRWQLVVTHLCDAVPRETLAALVKLHLSQDDQQALPFGQQVEKILSLPEDANDLTRCLSVTNRLGAWVDAQAMSDTAEVVFRLAGKIEETQGLLLEGLRQRRTEASQKVLADFLNQTIIGYGIPEKRILFRGDTLFVFDGEYSVDEMRMLAAQYMARIERKMNAVAAENDRLREAASAENPRRIPGRVRTLVWRRDQGRCVACGGVSDLEFDHIIPRSHGGASSVKNVQILCARCNARKGAQVARTRVPRDVQGPNRKRKVSRANPIPVVGNEQT
jgi:5-methylcytosine-specific restriction endonuclease McrA